MDHPSVVGLDISTHTGIYLLSADLERGTLLDFPKLKGMQRVEAFQHRIDDLLQTWKPELAVVEQYAHHHNVSSFIKVVEVGTVIRLALHRHKIPWVTVTPTTLKLWVTGYGGGKKDRMKTAIKEKWGFSSPSDDIVDAYALARMGLMGLDEMLLIPGVARGK